MNEKCLNYVGVCLKCYSKIKVRDFVSLFKLVLCFEYIILFVMLLVRNILLSNICVYIILFKIFIKEIVLIKLWCLLEIWLCVEL